MALVMVLTQHEPSEDDISALMFPYYQYPNNTEKCPSWGTWESFEIGGEYNKMLRLKDGSQVNTAKIADISYLFYQKRYDDHLKEDWDKLDDYDKERYITKENRANQLARSLSFSVLGYDGIWCDAGQLGYWEGDKDFIEFLHYNTHSWYFKDVNKDDYVTIVEYKELL